MSGRLSRLISSPVVAGARAHTYAHTGSLKQWLSWLTHIHTHKPTLSLFLSVKQWLSWLGTLISAIVQNVIVCVCVCVRACLRVILCVFFWLGTLISAIVRKVGRILSLTPPLLA